MATDDSNVDPAAHIRVRDDVAKVSEYIVEQRRHFHRHPELSFQEVKTAAHIAAQLRGLPGVEVTEGVGKTGVVVGAGGYMGLCACVHVCTCCGGASTGAPWLSMLFCALSVVFVSDLYG